MNLGQTSKSTRLVKKTEVKLCDLCGTLNYEDNGECFTCGWHGIFSHDPRMIDLAWQRLNVLYEEIRWEHVTAKRKRSLGDFGAARPAPFPVRLMSRISTAWERFLNQRDLRMAQRAASLTSKTLSRPDQLGV